MCLKLKIWLSWGSRAENLLEAGSHTDLFWRSAVGLSHAPPSLLTTVLHNGRGQIWTTLSKYKMNLEPNLNHLQ